MSNTVPLKNPSNQLVQVPVEQAHDYIQNQGFQVPAQQDLDQAANEAQYGGTLEGAKAAAEGAISGAVPGGRYLLNKLGDTAAGQTGRKAAHPGLSLGFEGAGLGAGLFFGTTEAKEGAAALEAANAAREGGGILNAVKSAVGAPTGTISSVGHAVQAAVTPEAASLAGRALGMGLGSAAEGAAYGLGQALDDSALGDSELTGENVLHHMGYGAVLGGGLGALMAPFAKAENVGRAALESEGVAAQHASPFEQAASELPAEEQEGVIQGLRKLKPNADEIQQSAADLGAPILPEMLSDSPTIQRIGGALRKRSDEVGIAAEQEMQKAYRTGSDSVEKVFANDSGASAADTGQQIKTGLENKITERAKTFEQPFDAVRDVTDKIPVAPEDAKGLSDEVLGLLKEHSFVKNTDEANLVKNFADSLGEVNSVTELGKIRTALGRATKARGDLKFAAGKISDVLNQAEEKFVTKGVQEMPEGAKKLSAQAAIDALPQIKKDYGVFKGDMEKIGKKAGLGKVYGASDFAEKLSNVPAEKLTSKLMDRKDPEFLQWMLKNAPDETKLLLDREKSRIHGISINKAGVFDAKKAISEAEKLSPEMKRLIFSPEEINKIDSGQRYLNNFPKNFNASDTQTHANLTEQFGGMTAAAGALMTGHPLLAAGALAKHFYGGVLTSKAMKAAIEHLGPGSEGKVGALSMLERMNGRISNQIGSRSKAIFDFDKKTLAGFAGSVVGGLAVSPDDEHAKTSKQITEYANNPEKLMDDLGKNTQPVFQFAPNVAGGLQKTTARATSFLNSKLPVMPKLGPLGPKLKPSSSQRAIFSNYMNIIENPLHAMDKIKEGTLVPHDLEALSNVYPKTLEQMQKSIYTAMIDHVDKNGTDSIPNQTKVVLSLFLGQDMDQSLSPQAVYANQMVLGSNKPPDEDQPAVQPTARPSQKGLSALNKSQNILTNQQQTTQRGVES